MGVEGELHEYNYTCVLHYLVDICTLLICGDVSKSCGVLHSNHFLHQYVLLVFLITNLCYIYLISNIHVYACICLPTLGIPVCDAEKPSGIDLSSLQSQKLSPSPPSTKTSVPRSAGSITKCMYSKSV